LKLIQAEMLLPNHRRCIQICFMTNITRHHFDSNVGIGSNVVGVWFCIHSTQKKKNARRDAPIEHTTFLNAHLDIPSEEVLGVDNLIIRLESDSFVHHSR
jgi:hypothetical protein